MILLKIAPPIAPPTNAVSVEAATAMDTLQIPAFKTRNGFGHLAERLEKFEMKCRYFAT